LLVHDNIWTGLRIKNGISLTCYREYYPFRAWGAANGTNPLDSNDPHGVYLSGTAGTGSGNNTLVVPGALWSPSLPGQSGRGPPSKLVDRLKYQRDNQHQVGRRNRWPAYKLHCW
jgi:hypothetical protein